MSTKPEKPSSGRLSKDQWRHVQDAWQYNPAQPTYAEAGKLASEKFGFPAPGKTTIESRAKKEGWERRGSMDGVNLEAQRRADLVAKKPDAGQNSDGSAGFEKFISDLSESAKAGIERENSIDVRTKITVEHREEWAQVGVMRDEAAAMRKKSVDAATEKMKLAKLMAEVTTLKQNGERKAWGMEIQTDPGAMQNYTQEQLEALASGKVPK